MFSFVQPTETGLVRLNQNIVYHQCVKTINVLSLIQYFLYH